MYRVFCFILFSKVFRAIFDQKNHDMYRFKNAGGVLESENVEIFENWIEGTVEIISGVPVVCVDGLIRMKKKLGREKDLADIALMEKVRKTS